MSERTRAELDASNARVLAMLLAKAGKPVTLSRATTRVVSARIPNKLSTNIRNAAFAARMSVGQYIRTVLASGSADSQIATIAKLQALLGLDPASTSDQIIAAVEALVNGESPNTAPDAATAPGAELLARIKKAGLTVEEFNQRRRTQVRRLA